jgi:hypothetical protein
MSRPFSPFVANLASDRPGARPAIAARIDQDAMAKATPFE